MIACNIYPNSTLSCRPPFCHDAENVTECEVLSLKELNEAFRQYVNISSSQREGPDKQD
jgi:hypothetical protein